MKGYISNKILYIFPQNADAIPYVDPTVEQIAVQTGSAEAWKKLNSGYADMIVDYNYYTITVKPKVWNGHTNDDIVVPVPPTPEPVDPELAWSDDAATVTIGADDNIFPTLTNPHSVAVSYTSSDTEKATINDSTGEITLVAAGSTTISAVWEGNDEYYAATETYTLTVEAAAPAVVFEWDPAESTIYLDEAYTLPTLTNTTGSEVTSWSSDNTDVATINQNTGVITVVGMGQTTLEAEVRDPETDEQLYYATCTLVVSQHASATIDGNGVVTIKFGYLDDIEISPAPQDVLTAIFTDNPNFTITYNGNAVNNPSVDPSYDEADPEHPVLSSVMYQDNDSEPMFMVESHDEVSLIALGGGETYQDGGTFVLTPVQL